MKPPDSGDRYGLEAQVAVLENELKSLRREVEEMRRDLRQDIRDLGARELLTEAQTRELCRQIVQEEGSTSTGSKDAVMRLVAFAVSIGTAIFVIRGGR